MGDATAVVLIGVIMI